MFANCLPQKKVNICRLYCALLSDLYFIQHVCVRVCESPRFHFCHLPIKCMSYFHPCLKIHIRYLIADNAEIYVYIFMFAIKFDTNHFWLENYRLPRISGSNFKNKQIEFQLLSIRVGVVSRIKISKTFYIDGIVFLLVWVCLDIIWWFIVFSCKLTQLVCAHKESLSKFYRF